MVNGFLIIDRVRPRICEHAIKQLYFLSIAWRESCGCQSISADNERIEATIWSIIDIPNRVRAECVGRLPCGNDFSLPRSHLPSAHKRGRVRHCFALT